MLIKMNLQSSALNDNLRPPIVAAKAMRCFQRAAGKLNENFHRFLSC